MSGFKLHPKGEGEDRLIATINTTPLVDVMLVLLIIFLITIPVVNTSVLVDLPREMNQAREARPDNVVISIDALGDTYWFDSKVSTQAQLLERLTQIGRMQPQPEVHIRADARAAYDAVGRAVYASQLAGIERIGFITEPPSANP